jgi:L-alanine-DL-glutamate epimerase-like enolase superfamily enzyme
LPVIADEDCQVEGDVERCSKSFHGVNVKLCKCGGITPAIKMLRHAKQLGLKTMVGCMIESSIGISAAAHLLPLLDYADLDGATLLSDDPARGVTIDRGSVQLVDAFGSGGSLK